MTYNHLMNAKCLEGFKRAKWAKLGRTGASQASVAIDENGGIFTWGQNHGAQSGQGDPVLLGDTSLEYIERATQLLPGLRWIKSSSGEQSSIALNSKGELWGWGDQTYEDSSAFGLPAGSGPTGDDNYYTPWKCTPGYLWKDVVHCMYYTVAIGLDNKLYTFGRNMDKCLGMALPNDYLQHTPLLNTYLTDDIKLIDCECMSAMAVTVNNKVYIWGDGWYFAAWGTYITPTEITGLPVGAVIEQVGCCAYGIMVLLADNTVWAAGEENMYGDAYVTGDSATFKQVTSLSSKGEISLIRTTALGSFSVVMIADGNIWSYGNDLDDYMGNSIPPDWTQPMLCASDYEGQNVFIDAVHNTHNQVFQAIDDKGYLWTWGRQYWGPHLAIGAAYSQYLADRDPNVTDVVAFSALASYASYALDTYGNPTTHNTFPIGGFGYVQPLPQTLHHRPCGHWHLREFFEEAIYPANCWMPSLAIKGNILLFAATGRWAKDLIGSGNEVLMFTYDIDANIWDFVMYEEGYSAANAPGGAAIDTDIYAYANWKADQVGKVFNEVFINFGIGVWVHNVNTGLMNYTYFADSANYMYMANKVAVYVGGAVAIAYTDTVGQLLVRVSTDYGVTWNLRKTVGALAARKDFSLVIDQATGYIFLAHQIDTSHVMVERSIDNGLNWTTRIASNFMIADILQVKLVADVTHLFLFAASEIAGAIESSGNEGTSWGTIADEPTASIVASGAGVNDDKYDRTFAVAGGPMYNYVWDTDAGVYRWFERDTHGLAVGGDYASLAGYQGRFAYSNFDFHKEPDPFIIVLVSNDMGATWDVRSTPLNHYENGEFPDFLGCPLFCLTDVPHLNHIWKFEKSNWAAEFVKQKDKYKVEQPCVCPQYRGI